MILHDGYLDLVVSMVYREHCLAHDTAQCINLAVGLLVEGHATE
jgi:hypothetical protein